MWEDVHIWRTALNQEPAIVRKLKEVLSDDELERASRFYFEKDKNQFIVGHGFLRRTLARYIDIDPVDLRFLYGPSGKPSLTKDHGPIRFNMSHSENLAVVAVTLDREIGIDVEFIHEIVEIDELADHFFNSLETGVREWSSSEMKRDEFFRCWVDQEAYLKALGSGLANWSEQIQILRNQESSYGILPLANRSAELCHWFLWEHVPALGYVGAVVAEGPGWLPSCWEFLEGKAD